MANTTEQNTIIKNIRKVSPKFCDNCGSRYLPNNFKIVKMQKSSALLHLSCQNCNHTYIINAYLNQNNIGSQRMALVVDLDGASEIDKFASTSPVSKDHAVDLFNLLNKNASYDKLFPKLSLKPAEDNPIKLKRSNSNKGGSIK